MATALRIGSLVVHTLKRPAIGLQQMKHLIGYLRILTAVALCYTISALGDDTIEVREVASGIYMYQGPHELMSITNLGSIGNSGFIIGERSVAVIDPGGGLEFGRRLRKSIEKVTNLPVEHLILTHFHPDHVAGAVAFREVTQIIAHENHARAVTQRAQFYVDRFEDLLPDNVQQAFQLPNVSVPVGQPLEIDLGGRKLVIEAHTLAHTDNDITVHDLQTNTLWASDLLFAQRTPSLDGSLKGWLMVLSELDERNYGLTIPGHGTPGPWSELIAPQASYLNHLHDSVRTMLHDGMALSDVLKNHDASDSQSSDWALFAVQHGSNLSKAYSELEWE